MKEIDFIPEWYKTDRKRRVNYKRQYAVIICLFASMVVWSMATGRSVSNAGAQVDQMRKYLNISGSLETEYAQLAARIKSMQQKTSILDRLESRIDLASIIAELSYLTGENIIVSRLDVKSEPVTAVTTAVTQSVTVGSTDTGNQNVIPESNERYKLTVCGIAANAADVAALVAALEGSPYFRSVAPAFSRNKQVKNHTVTEFEISCFIANYKQLPESRI